MVLRGRQRQRQRQRGDRERGGEEKKRGAADPDEVYVEGAEERERGRKRW